MSKTTSKLGRNPLEKIQEAKKRTLPSLEVQAPEIPWPEKIRELQIQVDWEELCKAAIEKICALSSPFLTIRR